MVFAVIKVCIKHLNMAKKKMFTEDEVNEIILTYLSGKSCPETGKIFGIKGSSVHYILKKHNIPRRTVSEGNSIKWENEDFRDNQINKKVGKPSGALGKTWKIDKIIKRPNNSGKNNHFWKGGKTSLSSQIRNSIEYSFWRISVFKRDYFTCQHCGAKNKKGEKYIFDAHHIYPFYKILDDFNITSIEEAISCEKLWDIENGITLCRECHKKTDSYGANQYTK